MPFTHLKFAQLRWVPPSCKTTPIGRAELDAGGWGGRVDRGGSGVCRAAPGLNAAERKKTLPSAINPTLNAKHS